MYNTGCLEAGEHVCSRVIQSEHHTGLLACLKMCSGSTQRTCSRAWHNKRRFQALPPQVQQGHSSMVPASQRIDVPKTCSVYSTSSAQVSVVQRVSDHAPCNRTSCLDQLSTFPTQVYVITSRCLVRRPPRYPALSFILEPGR